MSVSLEDTRLDLLGQLGGGGRFTSTGGTTQTIVCSAAFASDQIPTTHLKGAWAYVPSSAAPRQRRITSINTTSGILTLEAQLGTDIDDVEFEVHTKLPAIRDNSADHAQTTTMGLNEIIRLSSRQILVRQDDYAVGLVTNRRDYSLPAWLDRPSRLLDVLQPDPLGLGWVRAADHGHPWELRPGGDGNVLRLHAPYRFASGAYTLRLVVDRPGDTLVKVGGVWTDSTTGPTNESDEVAIDLDALTTVALAFCYRTLRDARAAPAKDHWERLYRLQVPLARGVRGYDAERDIDPVTAVAAPAAPDAAAAVA